MSTSKLWASENVIGCRHLETFTLSIGKVAINVPETGIKGIISSNLSDKKIVIKSINNKNEFVSHLGSRNYVRKKFGISSNRIYKIIINDKFKNWNRSR